MRAAKIYNMARKKMSARTNSAKNNQGCAQVTIRTWSKTWLKAIVNLPQKERRYQGQEIMINFDVCIGRRNENRRYRGIRKQVAGPHQPFSRQYKRALAGMISTCAMTSVLS